MDYLNSITNHNKNKHLQARHRAVIELRLKDGHSAYKIAKELGRDVNTVRNEIKRGTVKQIRQGIIVKAYFADSAQRVYDNNRKNSVRKYKRLAVSEFIDYVTCFSSPPLESQFYYHHLYKFFHQSPSYISIKLFNIYNIDSLIAHFV